MFIINYVDFVEPVNVYSKYVDLKYKYDSKVNST